MQLNRKFLILAAIIIGAALTRLIPHPMNFAPLGAMALFGSAYLGRKGAGLLVVMASWMLSDLLLNNFVYPSTGFVLFTQGAVFIYGSIALIYGLGSLVLRKVTIARVLGGSVAASVLFFVLSNLGVWLSGTMYPPTAEGFIACYTAAIPFFQNTLGGDLFYAVVLFLVYERLVKSQLIPKKIES